MATIQWRPLVNALGYHKKKQRKIMRRVAVPLAAVFCCGVGSTDALAFLPPPPSPCGAGRTLPANTWLMTAPSCEPSPAGVSDQYATDLNGTYNTDWISFTWDSASAVQNYVEQTASDALVPGTGNWLYSYNTGTLFLDGTATTTVPCSTYGSSDPKAAPDLLGNCFAIDLTPSSSAIWQIIGHPFPYTVSWKDVRVAAFDGTKWTQYTPSQAADAGVNLMAKELWRWNGSSYQTKDDSTPGSIGVLHAQESVWVQIKSSSGTLSAGNFKLLIPKRGLNDTGITWGGDYPSGNNAGCTGEEIGAQDCSRGADTYDTDSDGHAGFSYTKLDSNGVPLANQNADYATTPWACVRDNVTGLIWEVKTTSGLHNKDDTYTWYNTDPATNGGADGIDGATTNDTCFGYSSGTAATYCNTQAYVNRVNTAGWCGASDWRMPTRKELVNIMHYGISIPAIDSGYFPNVPNSYVWNSYVWSGSPSAYGSDFAWNVSFYSGYSYFDLRFFNFAVWLVRGGQ
ncbi:MAG: DUF1566 domain-containing protein [Candidatus Electrothrix sp. AW1]|nr:DUF1566 domain-containing protein [Candidatus Electrothrix sp. AX1]MCI5182736.1 DUF1566 domain-containing protein [Candidatus Electrothrix gigas]